jgi:hypothetical protein
MRKDFEFLIPECFQIVGDQPVVRVHPHVAQPGLIRLVLRPFDLLTAKLIGFFQSHLQFALHCQH